MRRDKILIFQDTMESIEQGFYVKNGEKISLKTSKDERMKVQVLLPDEIEVIEGKEANNSTRVECIYMDSFTAARREYQKWEEEGKQGNEPHILVLNFANAFTLGGGVRTGATAQEEDLCRKSTLLLSLESDDAAQYYLYNEHHCTNMGSDAMIITPYVEILKAF